MKDFYFRFIMLTVTVLVANASADDTKSEVQRKPARTEDSEVEVFHVSNTKTSNAEVWVDKKNRVNCYVHTGNGGAGGISCIKLK